jgi:hypothetical protein
MIPFVDLALDALINDPMGTYLRANAPQKGYFSPAVKRFSTGSWISCKQLTHSNLDLFSPARRFWAWAVILL